MVLLHKSSVFWFSVNMLCFVFSIQFFYICLITKATISVLFICIHIGDIIVALSITLWDQWFSYFNQEGIIFICLHVHPVFSMHVINIYWWWTNLAQWFWRYIYRSLFDSEVSHLMKKEAHIPYRSLEYWRFYTGFFSEGLSTSTGPS